MIRYAIPNGVQPAKIAGRPVLSTPEGGRVAVDSTLLALWQMAGGRTLEEITTDFAALRPGATPQQTAAALACLAEGGLLERRDAPEGYRLQVESSNVENLENLQPSTFQPATAELVSAIIVTYNSRDWLEACLESLQSQTYPSLEIVVVDNASQDDSAGRAAAWIAENAPTARLICLTELKPLSEAIQVGVKAARGPFYFILNPDVRLEPDALAQMMAVWQKSPDCAMVAAKLKFSWAPQFLNGLGNFVGPFSWGADLALGHLDLGQFDAWETLPSACFAAALTHRRIWEAVGPVDAGFPMYYEDSEWCYRARLLGYTICAAPKAVVYHGFGSGKASAGMSARKLERVTYGRLRFAMKITGKMLPRFLTAYLTEDLTGMAGSIARLRFSGVPARLRAWGRFRRDLPELRRLRRDLQSRRAIPDRDLFGLQRGAPIPWIWRGLPELTWDLVCSHYLPLMESGKTRPMPEFETQSDAIPHQSAPPPRSSTFQLSGAPALQPATAGAPRPRLLIVSNDIVDAKMAGPGMRYYEMARALSPEIAVTLAVPNETSLRQPGLTIAAYKPEQPASLQALLEKHDVALVSSFIIEKFPFFARTPARLVIDLYDPFVLENLHYYLDEPLDVQENLNAQAVAITNRLAQLGDFFICGNERQRDYWMGVLTANGRINPRNFQADASLRDLIDIVGIGFPDRRPQEKPFVRGRRPEVPENARIVLWGGGIWNWLDPLTLVQAWSQVVARHPEARLIFLGTRHPNPLVPRHAMAARTEALAAEIGEKDRTILFFDWLAYEDREALLCEADVGVSLHPIHVETRFSQRTRVLDYLWARLPVLLTAGDVTSEWVEQYGLGKVVPPFDVQAVAEGLCALLDEPKAAYAAAFEPLQAAFRWSQVVEPLRRYCLSGSPAADAPRAQESRRARGGSKAHAALPTRASSGLRWQWSRVRSIARQEGPRVLLHRIWRYVQWRLSQTR